MTTRAKPRKTAAKHPWRFPHPFAGSIAVAAVWSGYKPVILQLAKSKGCPAFRSTRVYMAELLAWMEKHMPEPVIESLGITSSHAQRIIRMLNEQAGNMPKEEYTEGDGTG